MAALADHAHARGMLLHVDGSRLANAAAALGVGLGDITAGVGADVVSFGGTKVGLLAAELVVILDPSLADALPYLRKQSMQLASKMRFVSAQLEVLLTGDLWRRAASHANAMARRLADAVAGHVTITHAVEANSVFAILSPEATAELQQEFHFYVWDEHTGEVRWMFAWDTAEADVDAFAAAIVRVAAA